MISNTFKGKGILEGGMLLKKNVDILGKKAISRLLRLWVKYLDWRPGSLNFTEKKENYTLRDKLSNDLGPNCRKTAILLQNLKIFLPQLPVSVRLYAWVNIP